MALRVPAPQAGRKSIGGRARRQLPPGAQPQALPTCSGCSRQPGTRPHRLRGARYGNPVVSPRDDSARRISRRVRAPADGGLDRHWRGRPDRGFISQRTRHVAGWLMFTQAVFVVTALTGILMVDARPIEAAVPTVTGTVPRADRDLVQRRTPARARRAAVDRDGLELSLGQRTGAASRALVARRAGGLYLANTVGAVCGSLATGFFLLPWLGIQTSAADPRGIVCSGHRAAVSVLAIDAAGARPSQSSLAGAPDRWRGDRRLSHAASGLRHPPRPRKRRPRRESWRSARD